MAHSITTRKGDQGSSSFVFGQRVSKSHPRMIAIGGFDELNAALGMAKAGVVERTAKNDWNVDLEGWVKAIQLDLVPLMGELATSNEDHEKYLQSKFQKLTEESLTRVDKQIADLEARGISYRGWATPGGTSISAKFDWARVIARRAERQLVEAAESGELVRELLLKFANRLSDLLWLLARLTDESKD